MVDAAAAVSQGAALTSATGTQAMGKEDFLKLLVAQLKNQDPLKPMDNTEFVSQLAQFSSLEQLSNISDKAGALGDQMNSMVGLNVLNLLGKEVKYKSDTLEWTGGTGQVVSSYGFDKAATDVKASIYNSSGKLVDTVSLGNVEAGLHTLSWDGKDQSGAALAAGSYSLVISGTGADGQTLTASNFVSGMVSGVTFQNSIPYLSIGGGLVPISNILEVNGTALAQAGL